MKSAGLPKIEMAGRNLSVPYAPPGAKRIDDDDIEEGVEASELGPSGG